MDIEKAKEIINHVVSSTEQRWRQYETSWNEIDEVFIKRGYERGGFEAWKFAEELDKAGIFSISELGKILPSELHCKSYDRDFAGSLSKTFYENAKKGVYGENGRKFYHAVECFLKRDARKGRSFWKILWQMLQSCFFLERNFKGSFKSYLLEKFREIFNPAVNDLTKLEKAFLSLSYDEYSKLKKSILKDRKLAGIGQNMFDFIFADIKESAFAKEIIKLDSSNIRFFKVTGIGKLFGFSINQDEEETKDKIRDFLKTLNLPYTVRQINEGVYTYCSRTEGERFGYCLSEDKCSSCAVRELCDRNFKALEERG